MNIWLLGILIFLSRIIDVSIGTLRTISIVQGRIKFAFVLGFIEACIWLLVLSAVLDKVMNSPYLAFLYALGFSTGNAVGILLERRLAMGYTNFRVISSNQGEAIAAKIRKEGFKATLFAGRDGEEDVLEVYVVCERKSLPRLIEIVKEIEPNAFYITEQVGLVSKIFRPMMVPVTGWRAIPKKK